MKPKGTFLAVTISLFLLGCQPRGSHSIPVELMGVWKSSEPKYKGCSFELTKDLVVFVNRYLQDHVSVNFIVKIRTITERQRTLYTIYYHNIDEQTYKFSFYYYSSKGGTIRLRNQKGIEWRKVQSIR